MINATGIYANTAGPRREKHKPGEAGLRYSPDHPKKRPIFLDTHCLLHRYLGEPTMSVGHSPFDDIEEFFMQRASDWAGLAVTDCNLIDGADWRDLRGGAGKEDFVRDVEHLARNHLLDHREA